MAEYGHEQVVQCYDKATGLKAIIGIHSTTLGPAMGGTRMWHYSSDQEAMNEAYLRRYGKCRWHHGSSR